jgi:hypothetical protein
VDELTHIAATCPSGTDPLNGHLPHDCGTIQTVGEKGAFGPCRLGTRTFPTGTPTGPHGDRTPATEAVGRLCDRILRGETGVGIFAFDGVADADYNDSTPAAAFGERVGQCAADGLSIQIVASPETYRYVYIFADRRYGQYAQNMARRLSDQWAKSDNDAVALTAAPSPADRVEFARPTFQRISKVTQGWDNEQPPITTVQMNGREVGHRLDVLRWSANEDSHGAAFALQWRADDWQTLGSAGTIAGPPVLFVNQDVVAPPSKNPSMPFVAAADARTKKLDDCAAFRNPAMMAVSSQCGMPMPQFFQRINVDTNRAEIEIYKGAHPGNVAAKTVLTAVLGSNAKPMLAMALVSPELTLDRCLVDLGVSLRGAHRWPESVSTASKVDDLMYHGASCEASTLRKLVTAFRETQPARFHTTSNTFAATADRRVGMESLTLALRSIADMRLKSRVGDACVLTTFRILLDSCTPQPTVQLTIAH